jgi:DNA-binding CsgD family transcriptional regulator
MQSSTYGEINGSGKATGTDARLSSLTDKQRAVLDLLIEFKTSKEISRVLAISPHTVDQRVEASKVKLGATSRAELALVYRELLGDPPVYERMTYEEFHVAPAPIHPQQSSSVGTAIAPPNDPGSGNIAVPDNITDVEIRVVPEIFDGRWGTVARLAAIVAITALFCVAFLGGLAIFIQLSNMFRG